MKLVVIFDLDDTLVDTSATLVAARLAMVKRFYGTGRIEKQSALRCWKAASDLFGPMDVASALKAIGAWHHVDSLIRITPEECQKRYLDAEISGLHLMRWVPETLDALQNNGRMLAIVTNGDERQQTRKFHASGLHLWFKKENLIVCDGKNLPPKPAPDGLLEAIRQTSAEQAIYVGDRRNDMAAGFLAQCRTLRLIRKTKVVKATPIWLNTLGDPDVAAIPSKCLLRLETLIRKIEQV